MEKLQLKEIYKRGKKLLKGEGCPPDYEGAAEYLKYGAEKGNNDCMHLYSKMLFKGLGMPVNKEKGIEYLKIASDNGHVNSILTYSRLLLEGDGVKANEAKAFEYLGNAAEKGSKDAYFMLGEIVYNSKTLSRSGASFFYKQAADLGDVKSMYKYAQMVDNEEADSTDETYDPNDYIKYYKKAADKLHTDAMLKYAECLMYGKGVQRNIQQGIQLIKNAADNGYPKAMERYAEEALNNNNKEDFKKYSKMAADSGDIFYIKSYIRKLHLKTIYDPNEEAIYNKKGADLGDNECMYNYAEMLYEGICLEEDKENAAHYYKMAADNGYPLAFSKYGKMLYDGIGVTEDKKEALNYFLKGVDNNDKDSMRQAGSILATGEGIPVDYEKAAKILKKVADDGDSYISFLYGMCLYNLAGEKGNKNEAFKYIKKAADGSCITAMHVCANMYYCGNGTEVDKEMAIYYLNEASNKGYIDSMISAGNMLLNGDGIPKNLEEASKFFKMAADKGSELGKKSYDSCIQQINLAKNPVLTNELQKTEQMESSPQTQVPTKKVEKPSIIIKQRENKEYLKEGPFLLHIKLIDAHLTPPENTDIYSNPFIIIEDCQNFSCHSSVFQNTLNPVWNEDFYFFVNENTDMKIIFASGDGSYKYEQLNQGFHIKLSEHKVGDHGIFNQKCYYSLTPCMGTLHFEYDILEGNMKQIKPLQSSSVNNESNQRNSNKEAYKTIKLHLDDERDWEWGKKFYP